MNTYDIAEAEARLDELVEAAARGQAFIIAVDGKPLVKVLPVEPADEVPVQPTGSRIGFLKGAFKVPDDLKAFGRDEIDEMFHGTKE